VRVTLSEGDLTLTSRSRRHSLHSAFLLFSVSSVPSVVKIPITL